MSTDKQTVQRPKELVELGSLFSRGVDFIDEHLREIQYGIYGVGAIGAVIVIRSLRVFGQFRRPRDIPKGYIAKNVKLKGVVRKVNPETGTLLVEHIPIVKIWKRKTTDESLLPVMLSGVQVGPMGYQWLDVAARNQTVDFTLLDVNPKNEVECVVTSTEGLLKKRCLNTDIVSLGLARTAPIVEKLRKKKIYAEMYKHILQLENQAFRERNGVWSTIKPETSWWSYLTSFLKPVFGKIKTYRKQQQRSPQLN